MNVLWVVERLGWMLVVLGAAQLIPAAAAFFWGEPMFPYLASAVAAGVFGVTIALGTKPTDVRFRTRDGFALASGAWVLAAGFGALPYVTAGVLNPVDALFESVAGFTTTASSVVLSVENLPRALLLWRSMTQWLGGMGVLIMAVALLPFLGIGGMQLFATDASRSTSDADRPRLGDAAIRLFSVYLGITVLAFGALAIAGLSAFDALCHALTSVSTGGFSTRDGSVGSFGSAAVEWVVVIAMFLGATSFVVHYRMISGRGRGMLRDAELRYYVLTIVAASAVLYWVLTRSVEADPGPGVGRAAIFQAVSMMSGTGYHTANFENWGGLAHLVLLALMVLGGMSGSTTGGIKSLRILVGVRALRDSFTSLLHPHAVRRVKYGGKTVPDEVLSAIWAFFTAYFLLVGAAGVIVASADTDLVTALSVAISVTANVGPALGEVGSSGNFSHFPDYVKLGLSFCMIAGRLDVFTLLVLLRPRFWRG